MAASLLRFVSIAFVFSSAASSELARGWGETIQWTAFADAHALAREQNKPIMVSTQHGNRCVSDSMGARSIPQCLRVRSIEPARGFGDSRA
jgi:hypothetical protein